MTPICAFDVMLPERPPTPNDRIHWGRRAALTKNIRWAACLSGLNKGPTATKPREVSLMLWHGRGDRTKDADNLVSLLKPLVDGIKDAKLIVDDSPQWVTVRYHQDRAKDGRRRCAVTVWE